jgi:hypothetical protein
MVIYSNSGFCLTLIGVDNPLIMDANGEVDSSSYNSFLNTPTYGEYWIDLYAQDALDTIEDESEIKTAINGYLTQIPQERTVIPINLFPIHVINDKLYFKNLKKIFKRKHKYLLASSTRATAFGVKSYADFDIMTAGKALNVIISDRSIELNKEAASINISFTCKKVAL